MTKTAATEEKKTRAPRTADPLLAKARQEVATAKQHAAIIAAETAVKNAKANVLKIETLQAAHNTRIVEAEDALKALKETAGKFGKRLDEADAKLKVAEDKVEALKG